MRSKFDQQLALLNEELTQMGETCAKAIGLAAQALDEQNASTAAPVTELEEQTNEQERSIEALCLKLLLQQQPVTEQLDDAAAQTLADALQRLAPNAVVTGLPLGKYIGCAGTGADRFVIKKLHISRSFPGTGDLYGAVLIGSLLQGNALSAAADNAAEFVSLAIQGTPCTQDTRFGVWFEPLLPRLCPLREEPEGIL